MKNAIKTYYKQMEKVIILIPKIIIFLFILQSCAGINKENEAMMKPFLCQKEYFYIGE